MSKNTKTILSKKEIVESLDKYLDTDANSIKAFTKCNTCGSIVVWNNQYYSLQRQLDKDTFDKIKRFMSIFLNLNGSAHRHSTY